MFETMFWDSQLADDNTSETTVALGRVGLDGMDLWVGCSIFIYVYIVYKVYM